ncbi:MAG: helix-turn-helix transcriptional regulator [Candidatus Thorarchaeota archaeon]
MRTPELKEIILRIAGDSEFYGYEIHKQLEQRKVNIGIGRLYSVLGEMKDQGLLIDRWEESKSGPKRRVYKIGAKGDNEREKILTEAIKTVHEFYTEYLNGLPPEHSVFGLISQMLTRKISKTSNIGYVATRFTGPMRKVISQLSKDVAGGKIYAITEQAKGLNLEIENGLIIEGSPEDIPVKDDFLDLLVITGNVKKDCLDKCLSEWRRVLSDDGILAFTTPTATITSFKDPLDIGEFIEQREHPQLEGEEAMSSEILQASMKRFFKSVQEKRIVHITLVIGTGNP